MTKRDYVSEILKRNQRLHVRGGRWAVLSRKLSPLGDCFNFLVTPGLAPKSVRSELLRYLPVAHVAALEGYFRLAYAELINHGDPYLSNASSFKDIKLSLDTVVQLHNERTTTGDFIAHFLPHNSPGDIDSNMSIILGESFRGALHQEQFFPFDSDEGIPGKELDQALWDGLHELFQLRHIACHELATKAAFRLTTVKHLCQISILFIIITDSLLCKKLGQPAP